jgi:hypothetical protein
MELDKSTHTYNKPYPFVDEIVETLFDECDSLIQNHINNESDKSIFMMFVMMYLTVHVKLKDSFIIMSKQEKKDTIKTILTEFIRDPSKRQACLYMFENKFKTLFNSSNPQLTNPNTSQFSIEFIKEQNN